MTVTNNFKKACELAKEDGYEAIAVQKAGAGWGISFWDIIDFEDIEKAEVGTKLSDTPLGFYGSKKNLKERIGSKKTIGYQAVFAYLRKAIYGD